MPTGADAKTIVTMANVAIIFLMRFIGSPDERESLDLG
jgi:hypothetical protein